MQSIALARAAQSPGRRGSGQHHGDLRNALEAAALELIAERGPRGFTLAEVTRRAGVSPAAPYKHFSDRDALLASLAARSHREQRARFAETIGREEDPLDQLAAFAAAYVAFAVEQRALFEVTFRAGLDKSLYPGVAAEGGRVLGVILAPARALRSADDDALELVYAVAASAHGYATFLLDGVLAAGHDSLEAVQARVRTSTRLLVARNSETH